MSNHGGYGVLNCVGNEISTKKEDVILMRDYVVIVGSGMMGSGIGAMSALAGNKTILE